MARPDNYDPVTNETDVYYQYQPDAILQESVTILPATGSSNITTIIAGGGGSVTGPTITLTTTLSGLAVVAAGTTLALQGTLGLTSGGTGAVTAAAARTNLEVPRIHSAAVAPAVTDDGAAGYPVGSLWVDTVLDDGYMSVDASAGAAIWKKVTP